VDRAAPEAGLSSALVSREPIGADGLRVRFEKARFDLLIGLLVRLAEQHGARVESASVDAAGEPGLVNAGLVLRAS
jgi:type II secretory pathway component PulM